MEFGRFKIHPSVIIALFVAIVAYSMFSSVLRLFAA